MFEYAEVNENEEIVGTVPRYFPRELDAKSVRMLKTGKPALRPIKFVAQAYDPKTQRMTDEFVYRVSGPVVQKAQKIVDLTADELKAMELDRALQRIRGALPPIELQVGALARVAAELLRVCDLLDGVGMQPRVSDDDRNLLRTIYGVNKQAFLK